MSDQFYTSIAKYYQHIFPFNPAQIEFLRNILPYNGARILDVGCATGDLSFALTHFGFPTWAFDFDAQMVAIAQNAKQEEAMFPVFEQLDMRLIDQRYPESYFDTVICFGNTLVHLLNDDDIRQFIKAAHRVLSPEGKLTIQILNYQHILDDQIESLPLIDNEHVRFERKYKFTTGSELIDFNTALTDKATGQVIENSAKLYPIRKTALQKILEDAEFESIEFFGSFNLEPLTENSIPLIVSCKKSSCMPKTLAVIDLGTNTCNLLIAEIQGKSYKILFQGKEVVKLGKNGIDKNMLTEDGLQRAIQAIRKHQEKIAKYDASETIVLATSAIREAKNSSWFQEELERNTGEKLKIISGETEAELIFKGVKLAFGKIEDHSIILDIGGGSNEFIVIENGEPVWKQSFPLGMARVIEKMPLSDPITPEEIQQISRYFETGLNDLWIHFRNFKIENLIGCSGAFDTLADLIDQTDPGTKVRIRQEIQINEFERIFEMLIKSTTEERTQMKGMESIRIEMIVVSVIFIKLVVDRLKIQKIYQTDFALREGVLYDHIFS